MIIKGESPYLNERSISDLQFILNTMNSQKISIDDLQFLIGFDGEIVISDPLEVYHSPPSRWNKLMIYKLIEVAQKNTSK